MLPGRMPGSWALSAHNDAIFKSACVSPFWLWTGWSFQSLPRVTLSTCVNNLFGYLQIVKPGFEFCLCHIGTGGSWEEPHLRSILVSLSCPAHNDVSALRLLQNSPSSQREKGELDGVRASTVLGVNLTYGTNLLCSRPKPRLENINIRAQSFWASFQALGFLFLTGDYRFYFSYPTLLCLSSSSLHQNFNDRKK